MRKFLLIILIILIGALGFLVYKFTRQPVADKDGNQLRLTMEEIEEEGRTGIFVLNKDGTFSPCIAQMPNYQGATSDYNPERFVWYVEEDDEVSKLIPTVTDDAKLVAIFDQDDQLPETHYLEKYKYRGYTIGAHIEIVGDKTLYLQEEDCLSGSQAASVFQVMAENTDDQYEIAEISGSDVLPINNIDPNMMLLLGLDGGKLYQIKYYRGTKEERQVFKADTKVFQSEKYIPITTPYTKTEHGYFVINLPVNLSDGYYYISDLGFFGIKR